MLIIDEIVVLDNFLPEQYANRVEKEMLHPTIPWHYMSDITYDVERLEGITIDKPRPAFAHKMYDKNQGVISNAFGFVLPIAYFACEQVKFQITEVIAARSFLTVPIGSNEADHPHVDREVSHMVVLYYVCDSDGDTIFYDKTFRDVDPRDLKPGMLSEIKRITPKKGRAVVFDGSRYHASTRPTINKRLVINFGLW
jgi:hypothetical protein